MARKIAPAPIPVATADPDDEHISLDLGNAYSNIRADNGQAIDFRSIQAKLTNANRIARLPVEDVITLDGETWAVGDQCYTLAPNNIVEVPTINRYTSPWYRRLFAFALHKAFYTRVGGGIVYPKIITSVPAELYKNTEAVEMIKETLIGPYSIGNTLGGALEVNVLKKRLLVVPEGIGTYFGFVFGPGNNSQYASGTWMIADSGYLTLDAVFVRNGNYIADLAKSNDTAGMKTVADELRKFVFNRSKVQLTRAEIDAAMACDTITVNAKPVNVVEARRMALEELSKRARLMLEEWATGQNLTGVILTGGGAEHLHEFIDASHLPGITLATNPRRSNCEGAYTYLTAP